MAFLTYNTRLINQTLMETWNYDQENRSAISGQERNDEEDACFYEKGNYLAERFYLITICGSIVALFGLVNNTLLVYVLTRPSLVITQIFYLAVLATFDVFICVSYILIFSVQIMYDYMENLSLYTAWNMYLKPMFALSHVSMTMSTFMIVAASTERYLTTASNFLKRSCLPRDRFLVAFCIFCFSAVSKGVVFWELDVNFKENCTEFAAWEVSRSELAQYAPYRKGYILWFRHVAHVFLPFISLVVLNGAIIRHLKRMPQTEWRCEEVLRLQHFTVNNNGDAKTDEHYSKMVAQRKKNIHQATMMLVVLVSTYLLSNVLNVVVSAIENFDPEFLLTNTDFYSFSTDVVSLLTILTSAIRLPTYYVFNKQVRHECRLLRRRFRALFRKTSHLYMGAT